MQGGECQKHYVTLSLQSDDRGTEGWRLGCRLPSRLGGIEAHCKLTQWGLGLIPTRSSFF